MENSNVMQASNNTQVLLQVIPVTLYGPGGQVNTHALLNPGSTCSLITKDIANQHSLDGPSESLNLFGIQETSHLKSKRVSFDIGPVNVRDIRYPVENALVAEKLNLPPVTVNTRSVESQWSHLVDLELKDMDQVEVEVVLSIDVTEIIIPREVREGPKGSPFGIKTKLGWVVTGHLPGYARNSESVCFVHVNSPEEEMYEFLKTWWKTESFGCKYDSKEQRSREDEMVLESLIRTTRKVDGRYEVGLIWKDAAKSLPDNRALARQCLELLEKRLERDPQLKAKYTETIENDLHKGYIKKLEDCPVAHKWYLPHHAVIHPHKPGKIRRVGDAAARYQGTSLNDCFLSGPDQWNSLVGILMRFREEFIVVSADIEAMFCQVAVPEEDQLVLRFLWRNNPTDKVEVYQYVRHIFAAKCSPTCANFALRKTAQDNKHSFPLEAEAVVRNFYMDDLYRPCWRHVIYKLGW